MPRDHPGPRPKLRSIAEVNAALAGAPNPPDKLRPIHILFVAGAKDHGIGEHDYPAFQNAWSELLAAATDTEVSTAREWPSAEQFNHADVAVFFQHGDWNEKRATDIDAYLKRGGGLVYIHWAIDGQKGGHEFAKRIGLAGLGLVGFRHGEETLAFNRAAKHPISRNFDTLKLFDETYWKMAGSLPADRVLATAVEDGQPQPQMWSLEPGQGRVFVAIPGHFSWTFDDPLFRVLLLRGIAWAAHEPVDRFNDLVWVGADISR
jgi:type 1 glutamine amidotransferase